MYKIEKKIAKQLVNPVVANCISANDRQVASLSGLIFTNVSLV